MVTAQAVSTEAVKYRISLRRATSTPRAAACNSPLASTLSDEASTIISASPAVSIRKLGHPALLWLRSPISQNSMLYTLLLALVVSRMLIRAPQPADTTTPVNSRRVEDQWPRDHAMPNTMTMESRAPTKAAWPNHI